MFIRKILDEKPKLRFFIKNVRGKGIITNYYQTSYRKNCLLMYIMHPFRNNTDVVLHQAYWQVKELSKIIYERHYNVDIIDYNNDLVRLKKNYDLVIDLIPGRNPVFRNHMNSNCKTIAYLTGSNASIQNAAEIKRIDGVEKRKGVKIIPRRQSPLLTKEIESYTAAFMIGNEYNWKTYDEFNMPPVYFIKNTGYKWPYVFNEAKKEKNSFLYFGSSGQVHKGLDLLLDIFSEEGFPCNLYVCGTFKDEEDFEKAYYHELYECKNIYPIGFINIESIEFRELVDKCCYSIMPSCSEGIAGSVLTTMSAGLINICSYECGLEEDEVFCLKDCRIGTIRSAVLDFASKNMGWIQRESWKAYKAVNERYSEKCFTESINHAFDDLLKEEHKS